MFTADQAILKLPIAHADCCNIADHPCRIAEACGTESGLNLSLNEMLSMDADLGPSKSHVKLHRASDIAGLLATLINSCK